ncbi:membrane protein [Streptomyces badius]
MSTTRHLVNRRRRLATTPSRTAETGSEPVSGRAAGPVTTTEPGPPAAPATDATEAETDTAGDSNPDDGPRRQASRLRITLPAVLCALTVLLGAVAAWAFTSASSLRDEPARQNSALTDIAGTSEVKGRISEAVGAVFSYDYASPARSDRAASTYLTGRAVQQHKDMLADVREQAPEQKLVLTTTVTESGVEFLDGDRARLLIFADQSNTRTGKDEETTYAAAMFAVDAVRRGDTWLIAAIDTFTR